MKVEKEYESLSLRKREEGTPTFFYRLFEIPSSLKLSEIGQEWRFEVKEKINFPINQNPSTAFIDFEKVKFPLIIRNPKEGDWFCPLGMEGRKKIKDLFIEERIPRSRRLKIPVLIFDDLIAWVAGLRIDHRVRITEGTQMVMRVEIL